MKKYSDSDTLYTIQRGYNEPTRMLLFHSVPIEANRLQEALDLIGEYNEFNSKTVGKILLDNFKDCKFVVGREFSVVVYVIPDTGYLFWTDKLNEIQKQGIIDEVAVNDRGELRLWWD